MKEEVCMKGIVQIVIGTAGTLLIAAASAELAMKLPLSTLTENAEAHSKSVELMSLMGIDDNGDTARVDNWSFPTSIVFNAVHYRVDPSMTDNSGLFDICSQDNSGELVASGKMVRKQSALLARRYPFVDLAAECTVPLYNLSQMYALMPLDSSTNIFYFSCKTNYPSSRIYLVYKNIAMLMRFSTSEQEIATNKLKFAAALMNAGLPENERVPLNGNGGTQNP